MKKLLIFDLDDTLIETSKCFLPFELRKALQAMVNAGLVVKDFEVSFDKLMEINETCSSGNEALEKLLKEIGGDDKYLHAAIESYYKCESLNFNMETVPGAVELLDGLKKDNVLTLVSRGILEVQMLKLEKAGIDKDLFSKIIINMNYNKGKNYEEILLAYPYNPKDVLVIGDKVKGDLLPAKALGLVTVFMNNGIRAKHYPPMPGEVDYSIENLSEILNILRELK